ncbi:hypothetical protein D3C71_1031160 [compost metagenome]
MLLQIEVDAGLVVDRIRLGRAHVVADGRITVEVGRVVPRTAAGLCQVPFVRAFRRAVQREADAGQPAVGTLEEALAGVAEIELGTGIAAAQHRFPGFALVLKLRRDEVCRRARVTVRVLRVQARVGAVGIHHDVIGRGTRCRFVLRCRAEDQVGVLVEVLHVVQGVGAAQRRDQIVGDLIIQAQVGGSAAGHLRAGAPHHAVGHRAAVGLVGVVGLDAILLHVVGVVAGVEFHAEPAVHEHVAKTKLAGRVDGRMLLVIREILARPGGIGCTHCAQLEHQVAFGALERVLAAQVDVAAGGIRFHRRSERVVQLDRLDAGDRHLLE